MDLPDVDGTSHGAIGETEAGRVSLTSSAFWNSVIFWERRSDVSGSHRQPASTAEALMREKAEATMRGITAHRKWWLMGGSAHAWAAVAFLWAFCAFERFPRRAWGSVVLHSSPQGAIQCQLRKSQLYCWTLWFVFWHTKLVKSLKKTVIIGY